MTTSFSSSVPPLTPDRSVLERLAGALVGTMDATYRYNLAIMNVYRAQGMLLHYNNIKLEELTPKSNCDY